MCELKEISCIKCEFVGEYIDEKDTKNPYIYSVLSYFRENSIIIKRKGVEYKIDIKVTANKKVICITTDKECTVMEMYNRVMEIMRFENLFEGLFYTAQSFMADEIEYIDDIRKIQLGYYISQKRYTSFPLEFSNRDYKKYLNRWLKIEKNYKIIHPVFLFSTYLEGMTVDLRMALLLEVFEPLAEEFHERGDIVLIKPPYIQYSNKCKKCGSPVTRKSPNKSLSFADKIKPMIKKYGKEIFLKENKSKLVAKAVKVRNKVDHVKADTINAMNGKQCGFYCYKFSLMYRYIMLMEIGIPEKDIIKVIMEWVAVFDRKYPHLIL